MTPRIQGRRGMRPRALTGARRPRAAAPTAAAPGQSLVEFALIVPVFLLLTVGMLDGLRVIFYYSQIQEAARAGAHWGAVQVARATDTNNPPTEVWGDFRTPGNVPTTYTDSCGNTPGPGYPAYNPAAGAPPPCYQLSPVRRIAGTGSNTIVGATTQAMTAVKLSSATISISTTIPALAQVETTQVDPLITNKAVSVMVHYPFKPILGMVFGGVTINLQGTSTMLHE